MKTRAINSLKPLNTLIIVAVGIILLAGSLIPATTLAKRGGDDSRARYYGIVASRPTQGLHGEWVIGGRMISTGPNTEFDQREGPLEIGTCAKVDLRGGRVHEIDSEPFRNCQ